MWSHFSSPKILNALSKWLAPFTTSHIKHFIKHVFNYWILSYIVITPHGCLGITALGWNYLKKMIQSKKKGWFLILPRSSHTLLKSEVATLPDLHPPGWIWKLGPRQSGACTKGRSDHQFRNTVNCTFRFTGKANNSNRSWRLCPSTGQGKFLFTLENPMYARLISQRKAYLLFPWSPEAVYSHSGTVKITFPSFSWLSLVPFNTWPHTPTALL